MIIRQRQTILDPLLLKVVFPYLQAGNHSTLLKLASIWNAADKPRPAIRPARSWHEELHVLFEQLAERWQRSFGPLARDLQPERRQALVTVAVTNERPDRRRSFQLER